MRMAVFQELTKTENSSDSAFYAPPFFSFSASPDRLAFFIVAPALKKDEWS